MKLCYMNEISNTCREFMTQVIKQDECLDYDVLMERLNKVFHQCTVQSDGTIDIDYKDMCFTVHIDTVLGQWKLCENASYYVLKGGFDVMGDVIDVELF